MSEGNSLIDLGNLSEPANTLINRVSDAVGGIAKPWQIKRVARAEAEAEKIRTETRLELSEKEERALQRLIADESRKQDNIESIAYEAASNVDDDANPGNIEEDWIAHFFDKSKNISNKEMQTMWARILAGEANTPGSFSKRAIDIIASLDKKDAELFTRFCSFAWMIGSLTPVIIDTDDNMYEKAGVSFSSLNHLDDLGLIHSEPLAGFQKRKLPKYITIFYFGVPINVEFKEDDNRLDVGKALFTEVGSQLAPISGPEGSAEFVDYVVDKLMERGMAVSTNVAARNLWLSLRQQSTST